MNRKNVNSPFDTSSCPLYHARLKCDRAKTHLRRLKQNIRKYEREFTPTHTVTTEGTRIRETWDWSTPLPDTWGLILSDFATNLRAALDYATWELAVKHLDERGETRSPAPLTSFPVTQSGGSFKKWASDSGKGKDVLPAAKDLMEKMQPYHAEHHPETHLLAILNELSNKTKHRFIIPPSSTTQLKATAGGSVTLMFNQGQPEIVVRSADGSSKSYRGFNPYVSLCVKFEVTDLTPSEYDISILDDMYRFVRRSILPQLSSFF